MDSTGQSGIQHIVYRNLLSYLGIQKDEFPTWDVMQQLACVHEDVLERLRVDTRVIYPKNPSNWELKIEKDEKGKHFAGQYGIRWTMPEGGFYFDSTGYPLTEGSIGELNNYPFPDPSDEKTSRGTKKGGEEVS